MGPSSMLAHCARDCDAFCDYQSYRVDCHGHTTGAVAVRNRVCHVVFRHGVEDLKGADEMKIVSLHVLSRSWTCVTRIGAKGGRPSISFGQFNSFQAIVPAVHRIMKTRRVNKLHSLKSTTKSKSGVGGLGAAFAAGICTTDDWFRHMYAEVCKSNKPCY